MSEKINQALAQLDVANDNHWTGDGLPRLETVKMLAGDQSITREILTQARPGFIRATAAQAAQAAQAAPAAPVAPEPVATAGEQLAAAGTPSAVAPSTVVAAPPVAGAVLDNNDELEAKLADLKAQLADEVATAQGLSEDVAKASAAYAGQVRVIDAIREQINLINPAKQSDAIRGYLNRQKAVLQERGAKAQRLKDSGINLKDILPTRAPIDVAMGRKTARGTKRPGA